MKLFTLDITCLFLWYDKSIFQSELVITTVKNSPSANIFKKFTVWAVCSCHVTYAFQSESTLYSYTLNIKELLARSRREIWRLSECNWTRIQNHLVLKRTLNHLVKLAKWLSCVLSNYLYGAFECMFLSCHVCVSEWIHTLQLSECQGTPCSKQTRNLKLKWLQLDSNSEQLCW